MIRTNSYPATSTTEFQLRPANQTANPIYVSHAQGRGVVPPPSPQVLTRPSTRRAHTTPAPVGHIGGQQVVHSYTHAEPTELSNETAPTRLHTAPDTVLAFVAWLKSKQVTTRNLNTFRDAIDAAKEITSDTNALTKACKAKGLKNQALVQEIQNKLADIFVSEVAVNHQKLNHLAYACRFLIGSAPNLGTLPLRYDAADLWIQIETTILKTPDIFNRVLATTTDLVGKTLPEFQCYLQKKLLAQHNIMETFIEAVPGRMHTDKIRSTEAIFLQILNKTAKNISPDGRALWYMIRDRMEQDRQSIEALIGNPDLEHKEKTILTAMLESVLLRYEIPPSLSRADHVYDPLAPHPIEKTHLWRHHSWPLAVEILRIHGVESAIKAPFVNVENVIEEIRCELETLNTPAHKIWGLEHWESIGQVLLWQLNDNKLHGGVVDYKALGQRTTFEELTVLKQNIHPDVVKYVIEKISALPDEIDTLELLVKAAETPLKEWMDSHWDRDIRLLTEMGVPPDQISRMRNLTICDLSEKQIEQVRNGKSYATVQNQWILEAICSRANNLSRNKGKEVAITVEDVREVQDWLKAFLRSAADSFRLAVTDIFERAPENTNEQTFRQPLGNVAFSPKRPSPTRFQSLDSAIEETLNKPENS